MDFTRLSDDPPPKPYCDHEFEWDVYYEAIKETYIARRMCDNCGDVTRMEMWTQDESVEDWSEEEIREFMEK